MSRQTVCAPQVRTSPPQPKTTWSILMSGLTPSLLCDWPETGCEFCWTQRFVGTGSTYTSIPCPVHCCRSLDFHTVSRSISQTRLGQIRLLTNTTSITDGAAPFVRVRVETKHDTFSSKNRCHELDTHVREIVPSKGCKGDFGPFVTVVCPQGYAVSVHGGGGEGSIDGDGGNLHVCLRM